MATCTDMSGINFDKSVKDFTDYMNNLTIQELVDKTIRGETLTDSEKKILLSGGLEY